ncbi:PKD domain-containing protein [Halorubrum trapanicum]|uniref:PKD domain-containing protein n=1 Tax=Halorubrum trapanicum TaxID=29284 RepID=UPI0012FDAD22|nr:PKD domain-containing protein [Halorubrum trapanicum]
MLLVGLAVLVVLAGCGGSPPARGQTVTVAEGVDRDCDGYHQSIRLATNVRIGGDSPADGDAWVDLSYRTDGGEYTTIRTYEDLSGWAFEEEIALSASDFGGERTTVELRATAKRSTFLGTETVSVGTSEPISVEPPSADESELEPSFTQEPAEPNRSEPLTLTAGTGEAQCAIESYEWDIDGDGTFDRTGRTVTVSYATDGRRDVTLKVTDASGTTEAVTQEVLVFHDPDDDGITTARERRLGTDPRDPDTDGDLFGDRIDPAPTTLFVPTGLLHVVLAAALYLGAVPYRGRVQRWFGVKIDRLRTLGGRVRSRVTDRLGRVRRWIDQLW